MQRKTYLYQRQIYLSGPSRETEPVGYKKLAAVISEAACSLAICRLETQED